MPPGSQQSKGTPQGSGPPFLNILRSRFVLWLLLLFGGLLIAQQFTLRGLEARRVAYSEFLAYVKEGRVKQAEIRSNEIAFELQPQPGKTETEKAVTTRLPNIDDLELIKELQDAHVVFSGKVDTSAGWVGVLLGWVIPIALFFGLSFFLRRAATRGPLTFGKSRVKLYDQNATNRITFDDVAGVNEAKDELKEVVDFLKNPAKYQAIGARIPKGVLLVGPPGAGKTLLARAVAGEAVVPFFSISGSEFIEMFVGVGAARIRDLFEQAKQRAPCLVFIDELDAIGRQRGGVAALATHDEREQTLNQLLVEMDGFDGGEGVVLMAATNRPEVLDRALVRAGRFDRQVVVDRPDLQGRLAILKVHSRKVKLSPAVDLMIVARRTPGMVGADLANLVNEAALAGARRGSQVVEQRDFEEAIDRIQLGLKKHSNPMNDEEKHRVAVHESGHALVALSVPHADPVHRVSIIPRSIGALGVTLQLPTEEHYLLTTEEILDRICVMLGGRAAEETVLGSASTGAQDDLERATELARQMVCRFGMSERLGLQTLGRSSGLRFLNDSLGMGEERNYSEDTAKAIDTEVRRIIESQHGRARQIVDERRGALDQIAKRLVEVETLERGDLDSILNPARKATDGATVPRVA
jgi:cell division protease FtsH